MPAAAAARTDFDFERNSAFTARLYIITAMPLATIVTPNLPEAAVLIGRDGAIAGLYRKMHIPDDPLYYEKYYFTPGDVGFRSFDSGCGRLGMLVCWDQWFPEAARCMALAGAEVLLYPTAIGSEPPDPSYDSRDHWQRVMQGHAAANLMPVVAANRYGFEQGAADRAITFYGSSFIADPTPALSRGSEPMIDSVAGAMVSPMPSASSSKPRRPPHAHRCSLACVRPKTVCTPSRWDCGE